MTTWTDQQDAVLREVYTDDRTLGKIAAEVNERCGTSYSRTAVSGRAIRIGLSRSAVPQARVWTDEQDAYFRELWATGLALKAVAERINERFGTSYSKSAITGRCLRFGLRRKPDAPTKAAPKPKAKAPSPNKMGVNAKPAALTKSQMYAMLADAVRNTVGMQQ